jgi:flagellar basal-body rod protein FlgB
LSGDRIGWDEKQIAKVQMMDAVSIQLIGKVLDGLHMRYLATAQNIANASSPGYSSMRVDFEAELAAAFRKGGDDWNSFAPRYRTAPSLNAGEDQRIDMELANAAQTAMRYSALIDMLGRQMTIARTLVRGG